MLLETALWISGSAGRGPETIVCSRTRQARAKRRVTQLVWDSSFSCSWMFNVYKVRDVMMVDTYISA
jgi:hypothetical protein